MYTYIYDVYVRACVYIIRIHAGPRFPPSPPCLLTSTTYQTQQVIFQNITFKVLGIPAVDKKPLPNQAGVWKLTYLDEDLRILYAAGLTNEGKPAKVSNIYILKRV